MNKTVSILLIIFALGCRMERTTLTQAETKKIDAEVKSFFEQYFTAIKKSGLKAEFIYLDHSKDFFWVPPGYEKPLSYDSVAAVLTRSAPLFISVENVMDSLRVVPLSGELAAYTAMLRSVMKDTSGKVTSLHLIETGILIKRTDGWKLLNGQTSLLK
jgi:hypothetical protein